MSKELDRKLQDFRCGSYEKNKDNQIVTKEFIDQMLDEVINEYGMEKGSEEVLFAIKNRLRTRLSKDYLRQVSGFVQADILFIQEALKKGFDINKPIDLSYDFKGENLISLSELLDKYYNELLKMTEYESINEFYNSNVYIANTEKEQGELRKKYETFKDYFDQTFTLEIGDNGEKVPLKNCIEQIKNQLEKKETEVKEDIQEETKEEVITPDNEEEIHLSSEAQVVSSLIGEYQAKREKMFNSDLAAIDYYKLEDSIKREVTKNKNDKSVAYVIAESEPYFLEYISENLQKDYTILKTLVKNHPSEDQIDIINRYVKDEELLKKIKDEISNEEKIENDSKEENSISNNEDKVENAIDDKISEKSSAEIVEDLIKKRDDIEKRLQNGDWDVTYKDYSALTGQLLDEIKKNSNDKNLALVVSKLSPFHIRYMSSELQKDIDIVRTVFKTNPTFASMNFDKEVVAQVEKEMNKDFEKQKEKLDSQSPLVDAVKNSYEDENGMWL